MHTLDIAPLRSESPSQKRSGMTRVLKGFQFYLCYMLHFYEQINHDDLSLRFIGHFPGEPGLAGVY